MSDNLAAGELDACLQGLVEVTQGSFVTHFWGCFPFEDYYHTFNFCLCVILKMLKSSASASFPKGFGFGHVCVKTTAAQVREDRKSDLADLNSQEWPINNFSPRYKYIVEQSSGEKIRSIKIRPIYLSSKHQFLKCRTIPQESLFVSSEICHWDLVIEVKVVEWGRSNFAVVRSLVNVDCCDSKKIGWNTPAWLTDFHIHSF